MKTSRRIFDSETMKAIGERLREVRGDRTLAEFTQKLGIARTTWSNYEGGRRLPSHEVLESLRLVEGVSPDRILPSVALARLTGSGASPYVWSDNIPALWLFLRLRSVKTFDTEEDELRWWAERWHALVEEFGYRAHELAVTRDLWQSDAAIEVCKYLAERPAEELLKFVDDDF